MKSNLYGKKILIVDDEQGFREILTDEFAFVGGIVIAADCVDEAEVCLLAHDFDLIISDSSMPGKSGNVFLKSVRASKMASIPFILMTGFADQNLKPASEQEADDLFIKPFQMELLIARAEVLVTANKLNALKKASIL